MINKQLTVKPQGWKKWHYVRTFMPNTTSPVPFGQFPYMYLPADNFWGQGMSTTCTLYPPWSGFKDPYSEFINSGGTVGILGSLAGLEAAMAVIAQPNSVRWALGDGNNPPITFGYCIGDLYKENVYFLFEATRVQGIGYVLVSKMYSDVFQRSILKRIYVHHGEVRTFTQTKDNPETGTLLLDLDGSISEDLASSIKGGTLTIRKKYNATIKDSPTIKLEITNVNSNWTFDVKGSSKAIFPETGDFYEFSKPLCIEDPLRISGIWYGKESERNYGANFKKSDFDAHITAYSIPYGEVKYAGFYVWKDQSGKVQNYSPTSQLSDEQNGKWFWKASSNQSEVYRTVTNRLKEVSDASNTSSSETTYSISDGTFNIVKLKEFDNASDGDLDSAMKLDGAQYVRIELDSCGSANKQNWHSPILSREWVKQNNSYFKIAGQPNGNVIDVSIKDITGQVTFDPKSVMSIFNQYAWMISEHYMGDTSKGIFGGTISNASYDSESDTTSITVNVAASSPGTFANGNAAYKPDYLKGVNSFYNRFTLNPSSVISDKMVNTYGKYETWRFIVGQSSFPVDSISANFPSAYNSTYDMTIDVIGDVSGLTKEKQQGYMVFDKPYERYKNFSLGGTLLYEATEGVDQFNNNAPTICLDAAWISSPIAINIPKHVIIGVCGGRYFGIDLHGNNFVYSENGIDLLVTTPYGANGLASFYNRLSQEDAVVFTDPYTDKITMRRGSLDFRDNPRKSEIVVGVGETANVSETTINLDKTKERVKSISFKLEDNKGYSMFANGDKSNIYGTINSGKGAVDFQALRIQKECSPQVLSTDYKSNGKTVSPIIINSRMCDYNYKDYDTADIGISTNDGPIYIIGNGITPLTMEYIKEKQTVENNGFFDFFALSNGEYLFLYNAIVPEFKMNDTKYNSKENKNTWVSSFGVFALGSGTEALRWECPGFLDASINEDLKPYGSIKKEDIALPLMILPDSEYLGGFLNPLTETVFIFTRGYYDGSSYVGCLQIPSHEFNYGLQKCTLVNSNSKQSDFLMRGPFIPDTNYSKKIPKAEGTDDVFVRVIGSSKTKSSITSGTEINTISPFIFGDGTIGVLFDSDIGINLMYSKDGVYWYLSPIIIANAANSPLFVDSNMLAYITDNGIEVKINMERNLYASMSLIAVEGGTDKYKEELQRQINENQRVLIGSGQIESQKLAGYKTDDGTYKIFFYTKDNELSCMESKDMVKWNVAANF